MRTDSVNISGILVAAQPGQIESLRARLATLAGVEVHAVSPEGRMVVTVERAADRDMTAAFDDISRLPGVLSAALVYHHDEALVDEPRFE
ncbi:MAG: chaperone NapD [Burkholderiales bacterium]|nr:chaperone NapD [Burkholderiales bacterium]